MNIPPAMTDCVCFVYAEIDGKARPVGTAFFMAMPIADKGDAIVVVTALHVIANIEQRNGKVLLRVNTKDGKVFTLPIAISSWVKPDQSDEFVDVCFAPWQVPWEGPFAFQYFSAKIAATADVMEQRQLGVGNEVAFAGLFVNHYGQKRNEPIVRFGTIAAIPREPVSTTYSSGTEIEVEAYLIESRSVGGLSGSPVFVDPGLFRITADGNREWRPTGEPGGYLLGVMHGHWDAPKEAIEADATQAADADFFGAKKEYINLGIALVTPIDKLLKVIRESEWYRLVVEQAAKHLSEPLKASVILQVDLTSGDLIQKVDMAQLPFAPASTDSPESAPPHSN
jgi:hypothetical protein